MTKFRLAIIAAAFTLLIGVAAANWYLSLHHSPNGTVSQSETTSDIGGPFALTDQDGKPVTEAMLKGKWSAVFFGYTYCPDVCPLTLQSLAQTRKLLGDKAKNLQIVFITVDPARDTPANLKAYLASGGFPPGVIGLTGTQAQIDQVTDAYHVPVEKVVSGDTVSFNHGAVIYLMDPKGNFNTPMSKEMAPDANAKLIRDAMRGG